MGHDIQPRVERHNPRTMSFQFAVVNPEQEADLLEGLCEGYVRANQIMIRAQPDSYPCCLGCGEYHYVLPRNCRVFDWRRNRLHSTDPNCQNVLGAYHLDNRKRGTCIDLACMLAAIYREKDDDPTARVIIDFQRGEPIGQGEDGEPIYELLEGQYRAMVQRGDGTIVDPTLKVHNKYLDAQKASTSTTETCDCGG